MRDWRYTLLVVLLILAIPFGVGMFIWTRSEWWLLCCLTLLVLMAG